MKFPKTGESAHGVTHFRLSLVRAATAISEKSLVDEVPFGYGSSIRQPSEGWHIN
jgi:hypothetical protein